MDGRETAFWAFSGNSKIACNDTSDGVSAPCGAFCQWGHEVDSHSPDHPSSYAPDAGQVYLLHNGDTIEEGRAVTIRNREQGGENYRECWTHPPQVAEPPSEGYEDAYCVVARHDSIDSVGTIVKIGDYVQGIFGMWTGWDERTDYNRVSRGSMKAERWTRKAPTGTLSSLMGTNEDTALSRQPVPSDGGDNWIKDERSTSIGLPPDFDPHLPCLWMCAPGRKVGDEFLSVTRTWCITEVSDKPPI